MADNHDWPDLVNPIYQERRRQWKRYPCRTNRASSLGADCERELVYKRTHWEHTLEPDPGLLMIFAEGNKHEDALLHELRQLGVQVLEQQTSLEWKEYQISGHIDAVVVHNDEAIPVDIKSMSAHIWDSIFRRGAGAYEWGEVEAAFQSKPWLRKYAAQIYLYALMRNEERGMLLCLNKGTGALAQVHLVLDDDALQYAEGLLQRAERINWYVLKEQLPDRIPFDEGICPRCDFYHICLPDQVGKDPILFLTDETIVSLLEERAATEEVRGDYERADKKLKEWAKAQSSDRISIGDWLVTRKETKRGVTVKFQRVEGSA